MHALSTVPIARRMTRRVGVALGIVAVTLLMTASAASAHPLGNFTVNRYARVELSAGVVRVYYVLDEAEIPAFQDRDALKADRDAFARSRLDDIVSHLTLMLNGTAQPLTVKDHLLTEPPGQGGLPTLRLAAVLESPLTAPGPTTQIDAKFTDGNEPDRIGWREIVVSGLGDAHVLTSTAPARDSSDELRHYPANMIQAPRDLRRVSFRFTPGTLVVAAPALVSPATAPARAEGRFAGLINRHHLTPFILAGMLGLALLFGAAHALAPGHGKTVMAAYLVGTRGRPRDAVLLGVVVSAMHTASVLVLGVVLFHLSRDTAVDRIYPVLKVVSGALVAGLGLWMLRGRLASLRRSRHGHDHQHDHHHERSHEHHHGDEHHHGHDDMHTHHHHGGYSHSHELPEGTAPLSRRGLAVLATAGGLFPSPSALVVLVSAFTLDRVALGLALVGAFSVGLAATLTAVGLLLVYGKELAARKSAVRRALRVFPVAGASAIAAVGTVLVLQGAATIH